MREKEREREREREGEREREREREEEREREKIISRIFYLPIVDMANLLREILDFI